MRKGKYEYLSFWWRTKANYSTDNYMDGGASYQDNSIGKMHKCRKGGAPRLTPLKIGIGNLMLLILTPER